MADQIGTLLWQMRTERGLSLGELAQKSGVHKSALSRWESGDRLPRVPELDAVLKALEAPAAQHALIYACMETPRALRRLNALDQRTSLGNLPTAGDLLRAMRLRGGWTQAQIALRMGVGQNTIARWEQGERLPSNEQMQAMCFALAAHEEEIVALTRGQFAEVPEELPNDPNQVLERIKTLLFDVPAELADLHFWTMERRLWHWAMRDEQAQFLLSAAYADHAHSLSLSKRWGEVKTMAERALELTAPAQPPARQTLKAVVKLASAEVYGGSKPMPERGLHLLKQWLPRSSDVEYTAWIVSDMAEYLALSGRMEPAVVYGEKAVLITEEERDMRRFDYARVLIAAGQPSKALEQLPFITERLPGMFVYEALLRCEAYLDLGCSGEATTWFERAENVMRAKGLTYNRPQADALALRL